MVRVMVQVMDLVGQVVRVGQVTALADRAVRGTDPVDRAGQVMGLVGRVMGLVGRVTAHGGQLDHVLAHHFTGHGGDRSRLIIHHSHGWAL